ncbi:MAG: UDP-N-acetylglucosamine 2-epimerase [bacterium]|nr:UDP-N-acetylglucosamine 2-epimerase [bacterium]
MKKIAVITGNRADYGIYYPILKTILAHSNLELFLIVTGSHLSPDFGNTIDEILRDGFNIKAKVDMLPDDDTGAAMAKSLGKGIIGITKALELIQPNILLILGDRGEMMAGAIAGAHMNIVVAHIHGGEVSGTIDESLRHAITKLSHIHLVATNKSAKRIIKLGEQKNMVFVVGAPRLDTILNQKLIEPSIIAKKFNLDLSRPILLAVQHPVTTEINEAAWQMKQTMQALKKLSLQTILMLPNSDAGGQAMIKIIKEFKDCSFINSFSSLPHLEYLSLMKIAKVMVGNSSSGIIEAPSFHLPVVNIGTRQQGRQCSNNIINVKYNKVEIIKAINKALFDENFRKRIKNCKNPYGDGKASSIIVKILNKIKITPNLLQKKLTY